MSVRLAIAEATARLDEAGCPSPRVAAELLAQHVLSLSRAELFAASESPLAPGEEQRLAVSLERRCAREPLAYILGEWGFRRISLRVCPDVLVPRPETEVLVERCLGRLAGLDQPRVLDIGTGSGAIALSIVDEHPGARVTATDCSAAALDVARGNAQRLGFSEHLELFHGDLAAGAGGPFELAVSNPPYVSAAELTELEPEVARFEPRSALVGEGVHERIADAVAPILAEENNKFIYTIYKFRSEPRFNGANNVALHFIVVVPAYRFFCSSTAQIGRHNYYGVSEVHCSTMTIGKTTIIENLE